MTPTAPASGGNTAGTYLKTLASSCVLGIPLGVMLGLIVGLGGLIIGAAVAVWVSSKAFRLEGTVPYYVVLVATVAISVVIGTAILAVALARLGY